MSEPARAAPPTAPHTLFTADRPVLVAIALNAIVLLLLTFEELADAPALVALDYAFTSYFVVEAALKIRALGWRGYVASGWNRFDFLIVLISLPSYAVLVVDVPDLSFLILLRLARVARFFRFIRFVPNMPQILAGARRAMRASAFVALAFFLFNFTLALIACHLFRHDAPAHFGDPIVAFYSIFKVFTVEGWYEIPDAIAASTSPAFAWFERAFFMVVVVGGGLFGLSLVNAIFVDEMLRNETDAAEERLASIERKLDELLARRGERDPAAPGSG